MPSLLMFLYVFLGLFSQTPALFYPYPRVKLEAKTGGDAGSPLFLTPYLKNGSVQLAQNLSRVALTELLAYPSYAGFFTVDETYNSNLYFWYFTPFSKKADAPVILWLQGGPGGSSLFGLFTELGPLIAKKNGFRLRKYHWALENHVIFIDNPVGTGFSFTQNEKGYCTNETCIAKGLYSALQQFFTLFPNLRNNTFCIAGESYAGKYVPALAMEIHHQNANGNEAPINLKCLAMGNAYCDPINQMEYGKYLYEHGLIDDNQLVVFEKLQSKIAIEIKKNNWENADFLMDKLMDGAVTNFSYFKSYTGFQDYYNILKTKNVDDLSVFTDLLQNDKLRDIVHVGGLPFNSGEEVQINLAFDILKSVAPYVAELLSYYPIMFYNGQLDIIVAYPLTENFLRKLNYSSASEYKIAKRKIWKVDNEIAGYVKKAGNLTEVLVRNAGHMVPHDQPNIVCVVELTCVVLGATAEARPAAGSAWASARCRPVRGGPRPSPRSPSGPVCPPNPRPVTTPPHSRPVPYTDHVSEVQASTGRAPPVPALTQRASMPTQPAPRNHPAPLPPCTVHGSRQRGAGQYGAGPARPRAHPAGQPVRGGPRPSPRSPSGPVCPPNPRPVTTPPHSRPVPYTDHVSEVQASTGRAPPVPALTQRASMPTQPAPRNHPAPLPPCTVHGSRQRGAGQYGAGNN
ncbi:unnamed protein product [Chilo suppressalis]|uniref:Carboxypeptidase n=1 Tax=Chilo suppressalis TaxID=168631 RepID=A0ABN8B5J3_CHISP|nr:unnamed protein product [Chilo suppressalis]